MDYFDLMAVLDYIEENTEIQDLDYSETVNKFYNPDLVSDEWN